MVHVEFTVQRRHLIVLVGILLSAMLLIPGIAWASHSFTDVPTSDWAHADIAWLKDTGLTNGCGDGTTFCPEDSVKRKELAAFMHRLSGGDSRTIDGRLDALEAENAALKDLLTGVTRNGDILLFEGMNIQLINGAFSTPTKNSLGNLIIGYNANDADTRTGSHMLVIGDSHTYTSFGGIVAGLNNTANGQYASVTGGAGNTASGVHSSVTGGASNTANGFGSTVSGGVFNTADGQTSSVSGGASNTTDGSAASVSGGASNTTNNVGASVTGGLNNAAEGMYSSVTGGRGNQVVGDHDTIVGGDDRITIGWDGAIVVGEGFWHAAD